MDRATGTAHSHAFVFGSSHSAGILRMYEEWNKDPLGVADCMEKHGFVDTDNYVMHFLNTGATFNWKEAQKLNPAMMSATSRDTPMRFVKITIITARISQISS